MNKYILVGITITLFIITVFLHTAHAQPMTYEQCIVKELSSIAWVSADGDCYWVINKLVEENSWEVKDYIFIITTDYEGWSYSTHHRYVLGPK